jgi:hypothetical protein
MRHNSSSSSSSPKQSTTGSAASDGAMSAMWGGWRMGAREGR